MSRTIATADFFEHPPEIVAQSLLGCFLLRRIDGLLLGGRITETEAYLSREDEASHSFRGITKRNQAMFGPAGTLYVYTIHTHFCLNAVTESEGIGSAVLIRAIEPIYGIESMQAYRKRALLKELTTGPARLCQALQINLSHNHISLCSGYDLWIELPEASRLREDEIVHATSRIGISKAKELPLRFVLKGNSFLSRKLK